MAARTAAIRTLSFSFGWQIRAAPATAAVTAPPRVLLFFTPRTEEELQTRATVTKNGPQRVLQIAPVARGEQGRVADEEDEGGRRDRRLRDIQQLEPLLPNQRRWTARYRTPQDGVQLSGGHATLGLLASRQD